MAAFPTRRAVLSALTASSAMAQPVRVSKQEAEYQDQPRGGLRCAGCTFFVKPNACKLVEGEISPMGWCKLFDLTD